MIKEVISVDDVLAVLNELVKLDATAMRNLIETRVECNEDLSKHESIQVWMDKEKKVYMVGFLGILNGLFGVSETGCGIINAIYNLKCGNGHKGKDVDGTVIGADCPVCGSLIELGDLVGFERMPDEYLYKQEKE